MTKLKLIKGIKKEKPDYFMLYSNAFINTLTSAAERFSDSKDYDLDTRRKVVWSGVKMINASSSRGNDRRGATDKLSLILSIKITASELTPREFQTVFPIKKSYDGEKHETKDYFYTKKYIEEIGEDKIIGENIEEFLMEYDNWAIRFFLVEMMSIASDLRKIDGGKGIMEEYLEEQGVPTYTMTERGNGQQFLTNNQTGEMQKVSKPRPRHLRVIK